MHDLSRRNRRRRPGTDERRREGSIGTRDRSLTDDSAFVSDSSRGRFVGSRAEPIFDLGNSRRTEADGLSSVVPGVDRSRFGFSSDRFVAFFAARRVTTDPAAASLATTEFPLMKFTFSRSNRHINLFSCVSRDDETRPLGAVEGPILTPRGAIRRPNRGDILDSRRAASTIDDRGRKAWKMECMGRFVVRHDSISNDFDR